MNKQNYRMGLLVFIGLFVVTIGVVGETAVSAQPTLAPEAPNGGVGLAVAPIESGFSLPVDIANAGDDRLFIVEQAGVIQIIDANGDMLDEPF
jgi:hypothetical protein